MKYDHVVKYNGEYYIAGEDVPIEEHLPYDPGSEEEGLEGDYSDEDITLETDGHVYTREDLERMKTRDIKQLAEDMGIKIIKTVKDDVINEFLSKQ